MNKPEDKNAKPGEALEKQESKVAKLEADFGDVYVKVTADGQILRPIKAQMRLYEKLGHFYRMYGGKASKPPVDEDGNETAAATDKNKYPILAAGYTHLNKVAGISILTPKSVIVDGHEMPNPYIERADRTRAITSVIIRKIGIGYAPSGAIVAIDKTLFYNTYTYFLQSIQAKMKEKFWDGPKKGEIKNPEAAWYGTEKEDPAKAMDEKGIPKHPGRWAFFPTEPPLGIWINYDDPAILDCLSEHTQRQRFGDRIAQRIVERNILKDHPAIGISQVFVKNGTAGAYADVLVYGYRHDLQPAALTALAAQVENSSEAAAFEIKRDIDVNPDEEDEKVSLAEIAADEREIDRRTIEADEDPDFKGERKS
jgi:hypothetical protein